MNTTEPLKLVKQLFSKTSQLTYAKFYISNQQIFGHIYPVSI